MLQVRGEAPFKRICQELESRKNVHVHSPGLIVPHFSLSAESLQLFSCQLKNRVGKFSFSGFLSTPLFVSPWLIKMWWPIFPRSQPKLSENVWRQQQTPFHMINIQSPKSMPRPFSRSRPFALFNPRQKCVFSRQLTPSIEWKNGKR